LSRNIPKEAKKDLIHISSLVTVAIARYLASVEYLDTVVRFFIFQETGDPPIVTKYPVKDHLVSGQAPQSESQKAETFRSGVTLSNKP